VLKRFWFLGLTEAQRARPRHASARLDREQHHDQGDQAETSGNRVVLTDTPSARGTADKHPSATSDRRKAALLLRTR
jgi:hypothetical protein